MIYLDNNSTTSLDPRVLSEMIPLFSCGPCNASSIHQYGQKGKGLLSSWTKEIAHELGVSAGEIVFTSGATEALNMLIYGFWLKRGKGHVITSALEHNSVLYPIQMIEKKGCPVTYLQPEPGKSVISIEAVEAALKPDTSLIALMAANNETGILTDIEGISSLAQKHNIPLLVDGVALVGKAPVNIYPGITAFCMSSHKFHGPLGVGVAVIRKQFPWSPLILGGSQQGGRRGGTENLPAIGGCVHAFTLMRRELVASQKSMHYLREYFEKSLLERLSDLIIHGNNVPRLCNTSTIAFLGVEGETLLLRLDLAGVAASHGAACSSGTLEPSRVLLNMGLPASIARSTLRFSLSKFTTEKEIAQAVDVIVREVNALRQLVTLS